MAGKPKAAEIDLTPLIDIVFLLLVFFMLAGTFRATDTFPVKPPTSVSHVFGDEREAVILVRADGMIGLSGRVLNHPEMIRAVRALLENDPKVLVQVKADATTDANVVIGVMEKLREAGVGYIVLLTKGAGPVDGG